MKFRRAGALRAMHFHIMHFAVPPMGKPFLQPGLCGGKLSVRDTYRRKTQFTPPLLDGFCQCVQVDFPGLVHLMNHSEQAIQLPLLDESATSRLGMLIAESIVPSMKIYFRGDLGAGKTTLVRAILRALGYEDRVKSPSYALVEAYKVSSLYLYHFDFYRLHNPNEWTDSGFREMFASRAACLVEWPEMAGNTLPLPDLDIHLSICGEGRRATLVANSESGRTCLSALKSRGSFS